jgi:hypothetical protein
LAAFRPAFSELGLNITLQMMQGMMRGTFPKTILNSAGEAFIEYLRGGVQEFKPCPLWTTLGEPAGYFLCAMHHP